MLSVIMPIVIMLSVIMLSVIMLSVVMLNVVAPSAWIGLAWTQCHKTFYVRNLRKSDLSLGVSTWHGFPT